MSYDEQYFKDQEEIAEIELAIHRALEKMGKLNLVNIIKALNNAMSRYIQDLSNKS